MVTVNIGQQPEGRMSPSFNITNIFQEFVTCDHWMHMDIAGVMENKDEVAYLGKGMSGRPTRTVANFVDLMASGKAGI